MRQICKPLVVKQSTAHPLLSLCCRDWSAVVDSFPNWSVACIKECFSATGRQRMAAAATDHHTSETSETGVIDHTLQLSSTGDAVKQQSRQQQQHQQPQLQQGSPLLQSHDGNNVSREHAEDVPPSVSSIDMFMAQVRGVPAQTAVPIYSPDADVVLGDLRAAICIPRIWRFDALLWDADVACTVPAHGVLA